MHGACQIRRPNERTNERRREQSVSQSTAHRRRVERCGEREACDQAAGSSWLGLKKTAVLSCLSLPPCDDLVWCVPFFAVPLVFHK